ncbi:PhnD/SsuA/transferrin family substrate-binding protein [Oscillibacter sp. MSJ-2]|uniref:PhnD/SsuA/transferrin family substrate-binding protein n=1 Tax=Dysosmobacter acutus TaxID=2841504 RepID=A0ABS6F750_9FIRM|nr:PhnD/SsuA/transferrin family substrate-binding protein [Dysosmobacter acutus]MBU5625992.1 PhnD/SsuA/transferrin family substrate-binding protein [Dysosmobacter acutus]
MKRYIAWFISAALLCPLLAGCGQGGASSGGASGSGAEREEPLQIKELRVELCSGAGADALLEAAASLPELLKAALKESGAEAERVRVTIGTSASATGAALKEGGVDAAMMGAADCVLWAGASRPILGAPAEGGRTELCTAPSDYGRALADRAEETERLGWSELTHAVWGLLETDSLYGRRLPNLWLADTYEGGTVDDLEQVKTYRSYEELLRGAAEEEVDVIALPEGFREGYAKLWTMEATRTGESGAHGFGRTDSIKEELRPFALTERIPTGVIAVSPAAAEDERLTDAIREAFLALARTGEGGALLKTVGGYDSYGPVAPEEIDALRRMLTTEGETWE